MRRPDRARCGAASHGDRIRTGRFATWQHPLHEIDRRRDRDGRALPGLARLRRTSRAPPPRFHAPEKSGPLAPYASLLRARARATCHWQVGKMRARRYFERPPLRDRARLYMRHSLDLRSIGPVHGGHPCASSISTKPRPSCRASSRRRRGASFVIAKAGRPMVRVTAIEAPMAARRTGFLAGAFAVPEDFDRMGVAEIADLFGTEP